jgi:outer membrane protein assembly factor BamE (lipoprotein component of BamABCDE complex)
MKPSICALLGALLLSTSCQTQQPLVYSTSNYGRTLFLPEEPQPSLAPLPNAEPDTGDHFTLGSSMNHVASVMGTPTSTNQIGDEIWWYFRYSRVTFRDGRVAEWNDTGNNLKVKLATSSPAKEYFKQGSTQDDVIAVMGTPTSTNKIGDETWWYYRYSRVTFRDGRVAEWNDTGNNLKVRWSDQVGSIASAPSPAPVSSGAVSLPSSSYRGGGLSWPRLSSPSRSYLYSPSYSDGYVDPHYRSGGSVRGYIRKDGTYVSPHYRSGGRVRGFSR